MPDCLHTSVYTQYNGSYSGHLTYCCVLWFRPVTPKTNGRPSNHIADLPEINQALGQRKAPCTRSMSFYLFLLAFLLLATSWCFSLSCISFWWLRLVGHADLKFWKILPLFLPFQTWWILFIAMRTTLDVFSHQRLGKCLLFYNMIDIDVRTKQIISQSAQFINPDGIIDLTI